MRPSRFVGVCWAQGSNLMATNLQPAADFVYVDQPWALAALIERMAHTRLCALDTEFIKGQTFYPQLGLIQLNLDGCTFVVDGQMALDDFWPALFALPRIVAHASGEDLDLIYHCSGQKPLMNLFDTQIGLAYLGHGLQLGYQQAVQQVLGVTLDKGETRSDWLARPLRPEQLCYAANDVIHLLDMAAHISASLEARGLLAMALEDSQTLAIDMAVDTEPAQSHLAHAHPRHSRRQLMQLQQLCAWRDQQARARNQPRSFVLKGSSLQALVEAGPRNLFELQKVRDLHPVVQREHGRTLLKLLHDLPEPDLWPARLPRNPRLRPELGQQVDRLIAAQAAHLGVPEAVLMRRKWLGALLAHVIAQHEGDVIQDPQDLSAQDNPPQSSLGEDALPLALLGWRHGPLTQPLMALLSRELGVTALKPVST